MDLKLNFESNDTLREKVADKLGLNLPSGLDIVSRTDYGSEKAYLDAAAAAEMKHSTPEFRATRRRVEAELRQRQEADERKRQTTKYNAIRSCVELDSVDKRNIDAEAAELARRDLAANRIGASDLGEAIEKYAVQLSEKRKNEKASAELFNRMLRGQA